MPDTKRKTNRNFFIFTLSCSIHITMHFHAAKYTYLLSTFSRVNLHIADLLSDFRDHPSFLLESELLLDHCCKLIQIDENAVLLGMTVGQTHLLDADLVGLEFVVTENDGEGNVVLFSRFELVGESRLDLIREFGL